MGDMIQTRERMVIIQENGIIRNREGVLIGRLTAGTDFNSDEVKDAPRCTCCGDMKVSVRNPNTLPEKTRRDVCPTCNAETLDQIRKMTQSGYNQPVMNI